MNEKPNTNMQWGMDFTVVAVVGDRDTKDRKHLEAIPDDRLLAAMEMAGLLQSVDENIHDAMEGLRDQMSPEDLENKRKEITQAITVGRMAVVEQLDHDMRDLLIRSATGEVSLVKSSKLKH